MIKFGENMAYRTLEDFFGDIVGKARRGQGISELELAQQVGLSVRQIGQIESYDLTPDDQAICRLADALHLDGEKLVEVARGWVPTKGNAAFEDENIRVDRLILDAGMTVNCYVLTCKASGNGAVIDPGGQAAVDFGCDCRYTGDAHFAHARARRSRWGTRSSCRCDTGAGMWLRARFYFDERAQSAGDGTRG